MPLKQGTETALGILISCWDCASYKKDAPKAGDGNMQSLDDIAGRHHKKDAPKAGDGNLKLKNNYEYKV